MSIIFTDFWAFVVAVIPLVIAINGVVRVVHAWRGTTPPDEL